MVSKVSSKEGKYKLVLRDGGFLSALQDDEDNNNDDDDDMCSRSYTSTYLSEDMC